MDPLASRGEVVVHDEVKGRTALGLGSVPVWLDEVPRALVMVQQ